MILIRLRKFAVIPNLLTLFIHEMVIDFAKYIFYVYWDDHVGFFQYSFYWYGTLHGWLLYTETTLHS